MIVLIDADSIAHSSCVCSKDISEDGLVHDIDEAKAKFDEIYLSIFNHLEEQGVEYTQAVVFLQGKNNFRKFLLPSYKQTRRAKPLLLNQLKALVKEDYNAFVCNGVETDDTIASYWRTYTDIYGVDSCIIAANDKDYKQLPCIYFDMYYQRFGEIEVISPERALYNFYFQMITGDAADNYNTLKGKGRAFAKKLLSIDDSEQILRSKVYRVYKKHFKGKAKEKYITNYLMAKLRQDVEYQPDIEF